MKSVDQKQIHKLRKRHNHELIKRMREGDPLKGFDNFSSWFPPRPVIKKDQKAIAKLYPPGESPTPNPELDAEITDNNHDTPRPPAAS